MAEEMIINKRKISFFFTKKIVSHGRSLVKAKSMPKTT